MEKILVVEDDESIREELITLLRANGYRISDGGGAAVRPRPFGRESARGERVRALSETAHAVGCSRYFSDGSGVCGGRNRRLRRRRGRLYPKTL